MCWKNLLMWTIKCDCRFNFITYTILFIKQEHVLFIIIEKSKCKFRYVDPILLDVAFYA